MHSYETSPITTERTGSGLFYPGPSSEETGDFKTRGSRLLCADAALAGREPPRLGGQDQRRAQRVLRKSFAPLFGRSSEAFIGICGSPQHLLGDAFIHSLGASEHLFCTAVPMRRIIVGHN